MNKARRRCGFTLIELLVVVAIIVVLIAILLPSLGRARELSNRAACAANVRGIIQALNIYATDHNAAYPIVTIRYGDAQSFLARGGAGTPTSSVETLLRQIYTTSGGDGAAAQNMWLLVLTQLIAPRQYLCKSDPARTVCASAVIGDQYQPNFNDGVTSNRRSDLAYSYSWAYMWSVRGVGGWWKNTTDAGLPLISDMGTANRLHEYQPVNSLTHQRQGQNVGFGDGHAEFRREVTIGHNNDNIFASHGAGAGGPTPEGPQLFGHPGIIGGSPGNWDICMVPRVRQDTKDYARESP